MIPKLHSYASSRVPIFSPLLSNSRQRAFLFSMYFETYFNVFVFVFSLCEFFLILLFILTFLLICVFVFFLFFIFSFVIFEKMFPFLSHSFPPPFCCHVLCFLALSWYLLCGHQKSSRGVCMRGQAPISTDNAQHTPPPHPSTLYRGTKAGPYRSGCSGLRPPQMAQTPNPKTLYPKSLTIQTQTTPSVVKSVC